MTRFFRFFALTALVTLAVSGIGSGPALAAEGTLNAIAYKPLQAGATVYVRPRDNSPENLDIKDKIERLLVERGLRLAARKQASMILTFETRDIAGAYSDGGRRHWLELKGTATTGTSEDGAQARLNLFDSQSGGLFNEGDREGTTITTPTKVRLDFTLDVPAERERLWAGWAVVDIGPNQWNDMAEAMLPAMVNRIGETVRSEKIILP